MKVFNAPCFIVFGSIFFTSAAFAQTHDLPSSPMALKKLSVVELMDIEVTSVTRWVTKAGQSAAAIFVITPEMIRRSGATTIPELFRIVPGMNVARIDAHRWAISVRGFNQEFANKLLVLIDGRAVYTPLFSGVRWEQQDTMLEDIERIEVIRGPAAALWGANAINGVINIITKRARDTQGLLISAGGGTEDPGFGSLRYGGKLGEDAHYRLYAKASALGDTKFPSDASSQDNWHQERAGFRVDWDGREKNQFTFQGDVAHGKPRELFNPVGSSNIILDTIRFVAGNLLARWTHSLGPDSDFRLQAYFDHADREVFNQSDRLETFDLDFQHRFPWGDSHTITWGAGYRFTTDDLVFLAPISLNPKNRDIHLATVFLRDRISLIQDRLILTLGSQLEYYSLTGFDYQPTARLKWTPSERQTVWSAVSRALRTPSRADNDLFLNGAFTFLPNRDLNPEEVLAYEMGYRTQVHERLSFDLAVFNNGYKRLRSVEIISPSPLVQMRDEKLSGETYGAEAAMTWQPVDWWEAQAAYSYLQIELRRNSGGNDVASERRDEGRNPHHQMSLQSALDITRNMELDCILRVVDDLPSVNIRGYTTLDVRAAYHPKRNWELAMVGQNLLDRRHPEFPPGAFGTLGAPREIERGIYGKIVWRY